MGSQLVAIEALSRAEPYLERYQEFARGLTQTVVGNIGWEQPENEPHLRTLLRAVVLSAAGGFGDEGVLSEAAERFGRFLEDESSLRPDLRAARVQPDGGTGRTRRRLRRCGGLSGSSICRRRRFGCRGRSRSIRQPELMQRALEMSVDQEQIRVQDAPRILMGVGGNLRGLALTWEFMKSNWPEIERRYAGGGFAIMRLVSITGGFTTAEAAQEVRSFFEEHPTPSATRVIQQSLERIELNRLWLERNQGGVGGLAGVGASSQPSPLGRGDFVKSCVGGVWGRRWRGARRKVGDWERPSWGIAGPLPFRMSSIVAIWTRGKWRSENGSGGV